MVKVNPTIAFSEHITGNYYKLGLFSVNPTNGFLTIRQPYTLPRSLKKVNANRSKELQNVLPKCNPFPPQILYHFYRRLSGFLPLLLWGKGWG